MKVTYWDSLTFIIAMKIFLFISLLFIHSKPLFQFLLPFHSLRPVRAHSDLWPLTSPRRFPPHNSGCVVTRWSECRSAAVGETLRSAVFTYILSLHSVHVVLHPNVEFNLSIFITTTTCQQHHLAAAAAALWLADKQFNIQPGKLDSFFLNTHK